MTGHTKHDDHGAVAVITALAAVVLFAVAALAVDLASAYTRKVAVQSVADVAARDAAAELPSACGAVVAGAQSLAAVANHVADDTGAPDLTSPTGFTDVPVVLLDGDPTNGEISAYGPDVDVDGLVDEPPVDLSACPGFATRVRVVAPPRNVRISFGQLAGGQAVPVTAAATAGIVSALPLLPLALPSACQATATHTLMLRQPDLVTASDVVADEMAPQLLTVGLPVAGRLTLTVLEDPLRPGPAGYTVRFSAQGVEYYATTPEVAAEPGTGTRTATVEVPAEVLAWPGAWTVRVSTAAAPVDGSPPAGPWSQTRPLVVAAGPVPACDATGRYGDLLTITPTPPAAPAPPVAGTPPATPTPPVTATPGDRIRAAAATGLSYPLVGPGPGLVTVTVNGAATHNELAAALSAGLLQRLGGTSPPACDAGRYLGAWSPSGAGGVSVTANNALSCYLPMAPGTTVAATIIDEPRAFLIPVIDLSSDPPVKPATDAALQVTGYQVAYITAENPGTPGGPPPCRNDALACNGIQLSASGQLEQLTLYRFDPSALPAASPVRDNGHPFTAGPMDVILLD